jgi:hypothetical protein
MENRNPDKDTSGNSADANAYAKKVHTAAGNKNAGASHSHADTEAYKGYQTHANADKGHQVHTDASAYKIQQTHAYANTCSQNNNTAADLYNNAGHQTHAGANPKTNNWFS